MKKIFLTTSLAVCLVYPTTALPLQEIIEEDVELLFNIRNLTDLREQWNEHPMAEIVRDESWQEWFESLNNLDDDESIGFFVEMADVFGLSLDDFFELFPGQMSLALYNISDQLLQNGKSIEFVLMTEFSGSEERLNELVQVQFARNAEMQKADNPLIEHEMIEETFMGETLYFDETFDGEKTYVEDGYALVDDILVLATPESRLREAVESIKEGTEIPVSRSEPYRRSREHSGRGDVGLYLNLTQLMPSLNATLEKLPVYDGLALFGITAQSLQNALSLESMDSAFLDLDMVEDGILSYSGFLYSEKSGLLSLLEYVSGELPEASYVPESALTSSISLFDLSAMYKSLETVLGNVSPHIISMLDIQMQRVEAEAGVDLRAGILENFGTQIVNFSVLKEDVSNIMELLQPQQMIIIDLKDAEAFSQALNALIDSAKVVRPLIEESPFEGETIYSIVMPNQQPEAEMEIHYTITRSKFILAIGHISMLQSVLSKMGQESDGVWQDPTVLALFEQISQPNVVNRTYYDLAQLIESIFEVLETSGNIPEPLQSGKISQSLKGSWHLVSEVNEFPGGIFGRTLIEKNQ